MLVRFPQFYDASNLRHTHFDAKGLPVVVVLPEVLPDGVVADAAVVDAAVVDAAVVPLEVVPDEAQLLRGVPAEVEVVFVVPDGVLVAEVAAAVGVAVDGVVLQLPCHHSQSTPPTNSSNQPLPPTPKSVRAMQGQVQWQLCSLV